MSSFTEPLDVRQISGEQWKTLRTFEFWHDEGDRREVYTVKAGFITDFASIPRPCWSLVGHPAEAYAQAAVLHDFLYRTHLVTRDKADALFLEGMAVLGVEAWRRRIMWAAVRIFGRFAW